MAHVAILITCRHRFLRGQETQKSEKNSVNLLEKRLKNKAQVLTNDKIYGIIKHKFKDASPIIVVHFAHNLRAEV